MASRTQWMWVWVSSESWWWTGKPGMLQSMGSKRVRTRWSNWTELILKSASNNPGHYWFPGGRMVKNLPVNASDARDMGSIPGLGRSLGVGNANLLHHSCLENPMDKGLMQNTVHRVPKSQTQLSVHTQAHTHAHTHTHRHTSIIPRKEEKKQIWWKVNNINNFD